MQRHNYATAFRLAHSEALSQQIREGHITDAAIPFTYFSWLGRQWIMMPIGPGVVELEDLINRKNWTFTSAPPLWQSPSSAIERSCAARVLGMLSEAHPSLLETAFDSIPISDELRHRADRETSGGAAIFPDGLAVFIRREVMDENQPIVWVRTRGDFVSVQEWRHVDAKRMHEEFIEKQRLMAQPQPYAHPLANRYLTE